MALMCAHGSGHLGVWRSWQSLSWPGAGPQREWGLRLLRTHLRPSLSWPGQGLGPQLHCCLAVLCLGWDLLGLGLSGSPA